MSLDPRQSVYIALAPLLDALGAALAGGCASMRDLVALVGADWKIPEFLKASIVRLALEWAQCAERPKVIEVNGNVVRTRRPRALNKPGEGLYADDVSEDPEAPIRRS